MQSFRQYRQLGKAVRAQCERDQRRLGSSSARSEQTDRISHHTGSSEVSLDRPTTSESEKVHPVSPVSPVSPQSGPDEHPAAADGNDLERGDNLSIIPTSRLEKNSSEPLIPALTGVEVRKRTTQEGQKGDEVFIVGFQGDNDPLNPHNWSSWRKWSIVINIGAIGWIVGFSSSVDSGPLIQAAADFGVSELVETLATGVFLISFGLGALIAGPFSEEFGRNPVYIGTMVLFMIFVMASGLAPNFGAQLAFRFLAGLFGSTPLTCAGGSISDMFTPLERVYVFPIFACSAFMGPIFGPVVGGFVGESPHVSWRFVEWITLIISACILASIVFLQPETYAPILLKWKAAQMRRVTNDHRYAASAEVRTEPFLRRVRRALYRPFLLGFREPIVMLFGLYLIVIYIVLFSFLNGYTFIFTETYGLSEGLTGLTFLGIVIGIACSTLLIPYVYTDYKRQLRQAEEQGRTRLPPEVRLLFAKLGAPTVPISLFWMGWTTRPDIPLWSPLAASVLFGYGILCIFISCYQYLIDSYELYAASALACVTVLRYVASGGIVIAAIPMYEGLGVHWTLTLMGCLSALLVPVPYLFTRYGERVRGWSKFAVDG